MSKKLAYPRGLRAGITPQDCYRIAIEAGISHHAVYSALEGTSHLSTLRKVEAAMRKLGIRWEKSF